MEEIKTTVLGVCISLLLIGFFLKLSPKSKLTKNMKHLLSMVILLIIITPLSSNYNINWSAFGIGNDNLTEYTEDDYKNRVVVNVASIIKSDVEEHLHQEKIGYYTVKINISENGEISEIIINIKSGYAPTTVEESVEKEFNLPCRVIIGN